MTDLKENINELVDETVEQIKTEIDEISKEVENKGYSKILNELKEKAVGLLKDATIKLEELKRTAENPEEVKKTIETIKTKTTDVYKMAIEKIKIFSESDEFKKTVEDVKEAANKASEYLKGAYSKALEKEEIKKAADKANALYGEAKKNVGDYLAKPETKEKIEKAKDVTIDVAEKAVSALKNLLKPEEK